MERIYQKLGVETHTAAIMQALATLDSVQFLFNGWALDSFLCNLYSGDIRQPQVYEGDIRIFFYDPLKQFFLPKMGFARNT